MHSTRAVRRDCLDRKRVEITPMRFAVCVHKLSMQLIYARSAAGTDEGSLTGVRRHIIVTHVAPYVINDAQQHV